MGNFIPETMSPKVTKSQDVVASFGAGAPRFINS
jgi:hypothetical protein